jgi:hypothetical protein
MVPVFSGPGLVKRYQAEVLQPVEGRSSDSFPTFRGVPTFHVEVGPLFVFRRSSESHYSLLLYQLRLHGMSVSRWIPSLLDYVVGEKRKLRAAYQVNSGRSSAARSGGRGFLPTHTRLCRAGAAFSPTMPRGLGYTFGHRQRGGLMGPCCVRVVRSTARSSCGPRIKLGGRTVGRPRGRQTDGGVVFKMRGNDVGHKRPWTRILRKSRPRIVCIRASQRVTKKARKDHECQRR